MNISRVEENFTRAERTEIRTVSYRHYSGQVKRGKKGTKVSCNP